MEAAKKWEGEEMSEEDVRALAEFFAIVDRWATAADEKAPVPTRRASRRVRTLSTLKDERD